METQTQVKCIICGSTDVEILETHSYDLGTYMKSECQDCGAEGMSH